jgi:hypothetical protein
VIQRTSPLSWRGFALLAVAVVLVGDVRASSAQVEEPSLFYEGGLGATAALVSLIYAPVKLAYAASGIALGSGSFLWTWGDRDAAMAVVNTAVGGDYVITPEHLRGSDEIHLTGQ